MIKTDILIIGGGVVGVCSAYYLAQRGAQVTLIEQGDIAAGSSYGNAGLIVPSHITPLAAPGALSSGLRWMLDPESPFYIKPRFDWGLADWLLRFTLACREAPMRRAIPTLKTLGRMSSALYEQLAALDGFDFGYERKGVLMAYRTQRGLAGGAHEARLVQEYGGPADILDSAQTRQLEPALKEGVVGGVYFPADTHLRPADFVRGLAALIEKSGVCLQTQTEVLGFETGNGQITTVRTTRGDFHPQQIILATGAWSPAVARELKLKVPIQAAKGYSLTLQRPVVCPTTPLLLGEAKVAVTPMGDELRLAGTLEMAGFDLSVNRRRVEAIKRAAREYLHGLDTIEPLETWRGLRPCTPDGLPLLGRSSAFSNLILAAGHAMLGMSLGPITGQLIAQIVCGEKPEIDLQPLRPERFA